MEQQGENVTLLYLQKQENIILEHTRQKVDYEIKIHLLNDKINQQNEKIKELIETVERQSSIIQQATSSIEILTEENRTFKENDKTKDLYDLTNIKLELQNKLSHEERKNKDLEIELARQNEELTKLYNESIPKKKKQKVQDETF